jgi:hypothetical protein
LNGPLPRILLLTPVKDAALHLDDYAAALEGLDWPVDRLSLGMIEGDSRDGTPERLEALRPRLERRCRRLLLCRRDFGFHPTVPRWTPAIQRRRRSILAHVRNELVTRALTPEDDWVLWLDVDLVQLPTDLIQRLLAVGADVVVPHVVSRTTGGTFDLNTWRLNPGTLDVDWGPFMRDGLLQPPPGVGRQYLGQLAHLERVVLDAVGACVLLVRADLHRGGLLFPTEPVEGLIESEGLAVLARAQGSTCVGLPGVTAVHW